MTADPIHVASKQGVLYIVATPIGNLGDLSPRAVEALGRADLVAAEDTRHSGRLLQHLGLHKSMLSLHDYNERDRIESILERLAAGACVVLISDAGTPLISDPGYALVREARERGLQVSPIPGPCALIAALSAAGLPTDRFCFEGFLPSKRGARKTVLEALADETATLIFYESPHRILETAAALVEVMGPERPVALARELTKAFETFYTGTAQEVCEQLTQDPYGAKGEFVVMVQGVTAKPDAEPGLNVDKFLRLMLAELPVKTVAKLGAELTGRSRNELYQRALALKDND